MSDFNFVGIIICSNPMEIEIFPATLREQEIPHRTEWGKDGKLSILVPDEWETEARDAIERAAKVFFNEGQEGQASASLPSKTGELPSAQSRPPIGDQEEIDEEQEDERGLFSERPGIFDRDGLPSPEETRIRLVWPAWVLAALPGTGLGHLYAGKFQMFLYLVFMSILGLLFFEYTGSWLSFLLNLFAWSMDLGFAALHIKEHNRRAIRFRRLSKKMEDSFYSSLKEPKS
jgi:hypothetical protein